MNPSTKPVILIVDPEADASDTVEQLVARYSHDYTIVAEPDVVSARQRMRALYESASDVALILADRASNGAVLLDEARTVHPHARRGLLLNWNESRTAPRRDRGRVRTATSRRLRHQAIGHARRTVSPQHHRTTRRVVAHPRSSHHSSAHRRRRTNGTGVRDVRPAAAPQHALRLPTC